jgi:hypothetical protein
MFNCLLLILLLPYRSWLLHTVNIRILKYLIIYQSMLLFVICFWIFSCAATGIRTSMDRSVRHPFFFFHDIFFQLEIHRWSTTKQLQKIHLGQLQIRYKIPFDQIYYCSWQKYSGPAAPTDSRKYNQINVLNSCILCWCLFVLIIVFIAVYVRMRKLGTLDQAPRSRAAKPNSDREECEGIL